ncbi:MAG: N-acetylglucosamine-6-phosphate deacetylase, partial [Waterburya sp.]
MGIQLIINARVIGYQDLQQVAIQQGKIIAIAKCGHSPIAPQLDLAITETIDFAGDWLSLGGIDLQINGALGLAFPDLELQDLPKLEQIC